MQKILPKNKLSKFIDNLMKKYQIIAPVNEEPTKFKIIKDSSEIWLKRITLVPPKQFFMPENQTLLEFKNGKSQEPINKMQNRIIFGLKKCDLNSLKVLDEVMKDPSYIKQRNKTITIGMHCTNPDDYCFCNSMELGDYYDLFFYPHKEDYYISIGSKKGEQLVSHLPNAKTEVVLKLKNKKKLFNKDIETDYKNKLWESDANKCLSCSACTIYCPTCNCFDINDKIDINFKNGERTRTQTSCQLKSFSQVAGGKCFRDARLGRFKHFVYHKISYFKKTNDKYMCVGCGRCLRVCPTNIDWVNTINKIKEEK